MYTTSSSPSAVSPVSVLRVDSTVRFAAYSSLIKLYSLNTGTIAIALLFPSLLFPVVILNVNVYPPTCLLPSGIAVTSTLSLIDSSSRYNGFSLAFNVSSCVL